MKPDEIVIRLCECGFDTYIVGGAVRDLLRGVNPKDEDIVTAANPDQVIEIFKDQKVKTVGKSFKVVLIDGIEVATFRQDRYSGLDNKNVEITTAETIEEDLSRRDLSINSMAFCQYTGEVIDNFNGREDLKNRTIRFTGDPEKRIYEDPNRIIRACRFLCSIQGKFAPETKDALIKYSHLVDTHVSNNRILVEIIKALSISKTSIFFQALHEIGALQYIFPSLDKCFGLDGGGYHKETLDVHNLICGDNISSKCLRVKLAGYLHDVGKIESTYDPETKRISFKHHEKIGYKLVKEELRKLKFPNNDIEYISNLISLHMREFSSPKAIRRILRDCEEKKINVKDVIRLRLADRKANLRRERFSIFDVKEIVRKVEDEINRESPSKFGDLNINGNEIMRLTGEKPGPYIGEILKFLLDIVTDEPMLNNYESLKQLTLRI
jgi:tRNA nucleotidyltransferase (CCA-adding enzyme)